ncbi:MAG: CPBP family glutamic-type intramembrane protease [Candidatus Babeliales bacterium]
MESVYHYKPIQFFLAVLSISLSAGFAAAYASYQQGMAWLQLLGMLIMLCTPCGVAIYMIYRSKNAHVRQDFWRRLHMPKITGMSLLILVALMPVTLFLATSISLLFGYSANQFNLSPEFAGGPGQIAISLLFVLVVALLEELGWRGYGVNSLRSRYNLFTSSMLFAAFWGLWHVPLFFIKDYYQYNLWQASSIYTLNFFASLVPATILMNWLYYKNNRNIIICVLFHAMLNLSAMLFQTEQFTKCIMTFLLMLVSVALVNRDKKLFFT